MKKNEVKVGGVYKAKVSNNLVSVKITSENPSGGWSGKNLNTGKTVRIKSAQRLRGPATRPAKPQPDTNGKKSVAAKLKTPKKIVTKAQYEAEAKAELAATGATPPKETSKDATPTEQRDTGQPAANGTKPASQPAKPSAKSDDNAKPLSLIKAAVCVLQSCERPLNCKEIVTKAMDAKIWQPRNGGLTPANTLSAAIRREIKIKDADSRFTQVERGKFSLASKP